MIFRRTSANASAPGKIIFFGEHFVIYNNLAILGSINRRIRVAVSLNNDPDRCINIRSDLGVAASYSASSHANVIREGKDMDINLEPIYKIAKDILSEREQNAGIDIYLVSEVPYGVGLGSSAASCVATGAAIDALFHSPDKNWLYNKATEYERLIHKDSSGADCFISTFGGLRYYMKEKGFENIQLEKDLTLLVVNTGIRHSTGTLVSLVRRFKENNLSIFEDLVSTAAHICSSALTAFRTGNETKLGTLMNENHQLLQKIGVSHKKIDYLVDVCIKSGALGAKLTGAGGGGCIITLVRNNELLDVSSKIEKEAREFMPIKIDYDGLLVD
jgi:mevalonate kinase